MSSSSRRALYRVVYPINERPIVEIGRHQYQVVDCSELGLRLDVKWGRALHPGDVHGVVLQLRRGSPLELVGKVVRARAGTVALELEPPGIPFARILAEQQFLRGLGYLLTDAADQQKNR